MADNLELDPNAQGKKPNMLVLGLVGLLLIGGSIGGTIFFIGGNKPQGPVLPAEPQYRSLGDEFIVNFQDQQVASYLQIGLNVASRQEADLLKVDQELPAIRNDILLLLSDQRFEELRTEQGKLKLREKLLETVHHSIDQKKPEGGIEAIYFTHFIMQ